MYKLAADTIILFNGTVFLYNTSKYYGEKKVCNLDPNEFDFSGQSKKIFSCLNLIALNVSHLIL